MLVHLHSVALGHSVHSVIIEYYVSRMTLCSLVVWLWMLLDHDESTTFTSPITSAARRLHKIKASLMHSVVRFLRRTGACSGASGSRLRMWNATVWYAQFRRVMLINTPVLVYDSISHTRCDAVQLFHKLGRLLRQWTLEVERLGLLVADRVCFWVREWVVHLTVVTESVVDGLSVRELVPDCLWFLKNVFVFKL